MSSDDPIPSSSENKGTKRRSDTEWDDHFMEVARETSKKSKDPKCKVGACIVNSVNEIVGEGYNTMPKGRSDYDQQNWVKDKTNFIKCKLTYVCHAELNAIANKKTFDVKGCTIYVTRIPCHECAKLIIQFGITKVVYIRNKYSQRDNATPSKIMFDDAEVEYIEYDEIRLDKKTKIDAKPNC